MRKIKGWLNGRYREFVTNDKEVLRFYAERLDRFEYEALDMAKES